MRDINDVRFEEDYIGEVKIPNDRFYGIQTVRGVENFPLSWVPISHHTYFRNAFAQCKWAAALANYDVGSLNKERCQAIAQACQEVILGVFDSSLVVDLMEGSGGTSTNMNYNEVIANRAQQLIGHALGSYHVVHPNDHVNQSQSTNDVYPTALKIATHDMLAPLIVELKDLGEAFQAKAEKFADILHLGRTCLQDAQPMKLGQAFAGYAALTLRLADELGEVRRKLRILPLGGTAIGTGFGSMPQYRKTVFKHLREITGIDYKEPADPFDAMQNMDIFARVSGELKTCAVSLAKVASDLTVLSSGPVGGFGELRLPEAQAGSSIMPGKVNPVMPMSIIQIGFAVSGNDVTISQAVQYGELEINHFEPVVASRIFDSITLLSNGVHMLRSKCIEGIEADVERNEAHLMNSTAVATALVPKLGYSQVSKLARQSVEEGRPLLDILDESGIMPRAVSVEAIRQAAKAIFK